jgi:hypothetical protein
VLKNTGCGGRDRKHRRDESKKRRRDDIEPRQLGFVWLPD